MDPGIRLSKRLTAIADMVNASSDADWPSGEYCLCDVGTDHAHIPISLLLDNKISRAIAMDVIEGPLEKARLNIDRYGVSSLVTLRLSDGLDAYQPGEAEGLVIAGMGGRIMRKILLREPSKSLDFEELILQPQADPEFVRSALRQLGLFIDREKVVLEDNKYYQVIHASHTPHGGPDWGICEGWMTSLPETQYQVRRHQEALYQEAEDLFGPVLIRDRDPILRSYLLWQKGVNDRILHSLSRAREGSRAAIDKAAQVRRKDLLIRTALEYFARTQ